MHARNAAKSLGWAVAALTAACSGPQSNEPAEIPEGLTARCSTVSHEFATAVQQGRHVPFALELADGAPSATPQAGTEEAMAERLLHARAGGQTWVIARGGVGKSRLADSIESKTCEKVITVRIDAPLDLRGQLLTASPSKPALVGKILDHMGVTQTSRSFDDLAAAVGRGPWLLIIDGSDELPPVERRLLTRELQALSRAEVAQPHLVRFERPGFTDQFGSNKPEITYSLPEATCEQVDAQWLKRFPDGETRTSATAWRDHHGLGRKRAAANPCKYVHMATWRDADLVADLAQDALQGLEELPPEPNRADLYTFWMGHRLRQAASNTAAVVAWLDRIVGLGVLQASDPDLLITLDRCGTAQPPGSAPATEACTDLTKSPLLRQGPVKSAWVLRNQTLADLLLARWMVAQQTDCALLSATTADLASLELTAMVASLPGGRRCLVPLVAAVCSRGTPAPTLTAFLDESLRRDGELTALLGPALDHAESPCEKAVFTALMPATP